MELSQNLCKPPNWCKIKCHSEGLIIIRRKAKNSQKTTIQEMMYDY